MRPLQRIALAICALGTVFVLTLITYALNEADKLAYVIP